MKQPAQKVLLLNPPSDRLYIRDQFCSHVSKGTYYWQPLDLLQISARLNAQGYELSIVDAIAERLSAEETQRRINRFAPDALVFMTGSDSFLDDVAFIAEVKRRGVDVAVGIGDILREKGDQLMAAHPEIDAYLHDFVHHGLDAFLQGRMDDAANMTVRTATGLRKVEERDGRRTFTMPTPPYGIFPLDRYRMPYNRYHPYATLITSSWCPYGCSFCPFARTSYRVREVDDVLRNMEDIRRLGIRQVHIADWTFAVDRKQATAILRGMIKAKFSFTWSCLSRVDLVDRELMGLLAEAGCDLLELGVESGTQEILDRYEKGITLEQIHNTFGWAREKNISTLATFVLGLPGETRADLQKTLDLALAIEPTFCSFNVASPRMGTELRRQMLADGLIRDEEGAVLDSSRSQPAFSTGQLSATDLQRFRQFAIRRFYLRPSYLLQRLRRISSLVELQNYASNGLSLIWQSIQSARARRT
ncbi:MAG: B12-binding domain-containing radical SAM protein [Acidobacteria bacterium]|nr:B12-binding domain-containing radical SAM protein [Acidobacteriota bacterium]